MILHRINTESMKQNSMLIVNRSDYSVPFRYLGKIVKKEIVISLYIELLDEYTKVIHTINFSMDDACINGTFELLLATVVTLVLAHLCGGVPFLFSARALIKVIIDVICQGWQTFSCGVRCSNESVYSPGFRPK